MRRVLVCFGTRPEAIKMAVLVKKLQEYDFVVSVCVTAQHREMLDQVLQLFDIEPDYDLNLMSPNQTLNVISSKIFSEMDKVLDDFKPDLVLVHGDTTTASICAWSAFNKQIKVGHVEAGLRTYNKYSPFPEELNRQIIGRIADFHFSPTITSKENLLKEGIHDSSIVVTGNTVIDSLFWTLKNIDETKNNKIIELKDLIDIDKRIILVTGHRRENFGGGIQNICESLLKISDIDDTEIVFPVHLNPNIKEPVLDILSHKKNIKLIEPLDYESFIWLMKKAYLIITDSGGIQEEAPSLGKPVLVTRDTTERPEALQAGTVKLVGSNANRIFNEAAQLLQDNNKFDKMSNAHNPYGDGDACSKIIDFLIK